MCGRRSATPEMIVGMDLIELEIEIEMMILGIFGEAHCLSFDLSFDVAARSWWLGTV